MRAEPQPPGPSKETVRPFARRDAGRAVAIARLCPEASSWPEDTYARLSELGYRGWVSVEGEEVCGFLVARCAAGEAEILNLAVRPDRRRRGHGRAMLRQALEDLRAAGVREVHLEVRESNRGARAFYGGEGFRPSGRRVSYYDHPKEDAVCMALTLAPAVHPPAC